MTNLVGSPGVGARAESEPVPLDPVVVLKFMGLVADRLDLEGGGLKIFATASTRDGVFDWAAYTVRTHAEYWDALHGDKDGVPSLADHFTDEQVAALCAVRTREVRDAFWADGSGTFQIRGNDGYGWEMTFYVREDSNAESI